MDDFISHSSSVDQNLFVQWNEAQHRLAKHVNNLESMARTPLVVSPASLQALSKAAETLVTTTTAATLSNSSLEEEDTERILNDTVLLIERMKDENLPLSKYQPSNIVLKTIY